MVLKKPAIARPTVFAEVESGRGQLLSLSRSALRASRCRFLGLAEPWSDCFAGRKKQTGGGDLSRTGQVPLLNVGSGIMSSFSFGFVL